MTNDPMPEKVLLIVNAKNNDFENYAIEQAKHWMTMHTLETIAKYQNKFDILVSINTVMEHPGL